ncbi:hypothetical protein E2C01_087189 [Portunus trituberculatus]|uniref:Uncharacterized protein n=1 Tax=Portunus trituberculatus TaxID=210409 RepID=A0A5B7JFI2_PORTR|nr:hypothetical protein [Portunus trituberculatus]
MSRRGREARVKEDSGGRCKRFVNAVKEDIFVMTVTEEARFCIDNGERTPLRTRLITTVAFENSLYEVLCPGRSLEHLRAK